MKHQIVGLAALFLVGIVVLIPGPVLGQENLLVNGNLEDGVVDPWVSYMVDLEVVDELVGAAIPDVPYEGSYCLHATVATVGGNFWERWIKPNNNELVFEEGKKYTFSAFFKSSQGIFRIRMKPEKSAEGYGSIEVQATDEWQELSVTTPVFTTTLEGADVALLIGYAEGDIWIDNARFYEGDYVPPSLPTEARNPDPEDGATDVTFNDPPLSWKVTELGSGFNVYLSTNFDDVNGADAGALVAAGLEDTTFSPGELALGETYYWRVDALDGVASPVWSFTVEPISRPVTGITATASSAAGVNYGPEKTIDGSGLTGDLHSTLDTDMWLSEPGLPAWIQYEFARPEVLDQMWVWNSNMGLESLFGYGVQNITVETSLDGLAWTVLEGVDTLAQAPGLPDYAANTTIDFGRTPAQYVRLTINSGYGQTQYVGLSEVRFYAIPVYARDPQPADGAITDSLEVTLEWSAGRQADSHTILLSSDIDAVLDGSAIIDTVATASLDLADVGMALDLGTFYYWQVIEVDAANSYAGDIWSFLTPSDRIIDDMESYDVTDNLIWAAWVDGYGNEENNGAYVGNGDEAETEIVYEGDQAMPYEYHNTVALTSEATRTFEPALDLAAGAPDTLSLYFQGSADNGPEPIYVALTDSANRREVVVHPNMEATLVTDYEEWAISLNGLANLDLANIKSITIGVGDPDSTQASGAEGKIYIDNILVSKVR